METVQLQCGSCMNMMAISAEHLGQQVQCPHCQAIVQTPPASAFGLAPPGPIRRSRAAAELCDRAAADHGIGAAGEHLRGGGAVGRSCSIEAPRTPKIHMPDDNHEPEHAAVAVEEQEPEEEYEEPADLSAMRARLASARQSSNRRPDAAGLPRSLRHLLQRLHRLSAHELADDRTARLPSRSEDAEGGQAAGAS